MMNWAKKARTSRIHRCAATAAADANDDDSNGDNDAVASITG